jgi:hypothetical protein
MKSDSVYRSPTVQPAPISIGRGEHTFGIVTLARSGDLEIDGDVPRITRLLASSRRMPGYRDLSTQEFFASIPEALCDGLTWATPLESLPAGEALIP